MSTATTPTTDGTGTPGTGGPGASDEVARWVEHVCRAVVERTGDLDHLVDQEVRRVAPLASVRTRAAVQRGALARLRGLGQLEPLLEDPAVDEVLVNGGDQIWVDRGGQLQREGTLAGHDLGHLIERILAPLGRRVDRSSPVVDARLPDGSRVCAVVPPVSIDGPCLAIRRFPRRVRPLADFTERNGEDCCRQLVDRRCNVVVSGATSSGKTSLLASLLGSLPDDERLVVIEDTAELPIRQGHVLRLEARPANADGPGEITLTDLVRTALRLRPDRLVLGEVRGDEVVGVVQALNTGHDGSFATCHANGPLDALLRLETLVAQAAPHWPLAAIRQQLGRSLDAVIHVARDRDGRRRITSIAEVVEPDAAEPGAPPAIRSVIERADDGLRTVAPLRRTRVVP